MKQRSVMAHNFAQVPKAEIPRSSFDRSHGLKTTLDEGGKLYPIFVDDVLPGDTFNLKMTAFARLATPIFPVMDNMFMDSFFFFVPYRLLWDNWERFCGMEPDPGDSVDFTIPVIASAAGGFAEKSIYDYMGIPTINGGVTTVSALPFRAYNLIHNDWFRDQNLQLQNVNLRGNGPDGFTNYDVLSRGKRHDYFTSCLPWPQKGGSSVSLPLGTAANVLTSSTLNLVPTAATGMNIREIDGTTPVAAELIQHSIGGGIIGDNTAVGTPQNIALFPSNLYADLTTATAATINQLRQAFQIQKLLERDARGGTRYVEIIKSHFGVTSPDARLQRPEYLGGGSTPVNISPLAQTSETLVGTSLATLSGIGTAALHNHGFTKSFTEHGCIIGLVSVRADLTYQQGLERMWSRSTRYDFFWPALQGIGEQAVLNQEIFSEGAGNDDTGVFGYNERYSEYRYKPSRICGLFRSNATGSLEAWHLSQDFAAVPTLGATFIKDTPPIDRILAVPSEPHFLFDAYFDLRCARPLPTYGVPGLIDHF